MNSTKVHIIGGSGKMGSWLKNYLEKNGFVVSVSGSTDTEKNRSLTTADIVFFSVPISVAPDIIQRTARHVKKNSLLVDLSSITYGTSKIFHKLNLASLSIHFLFGPTVTNIANQKIIFIYTKKHPLIQKLKQLLTKDGAGVFEMDYSMHDLNMSYIQALTHFVNLILAETVLNNVSPNITTPNFLNQYVITLRTLTNNSPKLLTEIQMLNPEFKKILKNFIERQNEILLYLEIDDNKSIESIYKDITNKIINLQNKIPTLPDSNKSTNKELTKKYKTIGYLGPVGTYSYEAAKKLFNTDSSKLISYSTIYDIFKAVSLKKIEAGVVPAENSTEGPIRETLNYLIEFSLIVNSSIDLSINHCLLSKETSIRKISKIIAHTQGLAQCRQWIRKNIPNAVLETSESNIAKIKNLQKGDGVALIGSKYAAGTHGLSILAENIQNNPDNTTRFYVISNDEPNANAKKTLIFLTVHNRVGILRDILTVFADFGIDLSKLESRSSQEKNWDYYFFIEATSSPKSKVLSQALEQLAQYCPKIAIIGGI